MKVVVAALAVTAVILAQSAVLEFEVAAIKPSPPDFKGRYFRMEGSQFVARNHSVKTLIAGAYNLSLRAISGGPEWVESDHWDILAKPPGTRRPKLDEQMAMLRNLLADRFQLSFHRETKELPIYTLNVAKNGPKLKNPAPTPDGPPPLIFVVGSGGVTLPGRNATMGELAWVMQRGALDRPVIDKTGLTGRYDFDLAFTPDEFQFGGLLPRENESSSAPDLYTAMQQQLGLKLESSRGPVETLVIDRVARPTEN